MRKRLPIILILALLVAAVGLGAWVLVRNDQAAIDEPTATAYVTSSPVATVKPTDAIVSPTGIPPTLAPTLTPVPPLSLRFDSFHELWYTFASLNEEDIIELYRLNLSDYRFPDDFPFVVRDGAMHLRIRVDDETYYLETSFNQGTMQQFCTPSGDAGKLLCTIGRGRSYEGDLGISDSDREALLAKAGTEDAVSEIHKQLADAHLDKRYFILERDSRDIYMLPKQGEKGEYKRSFRTMCSWFDDAKIECHQVFGTVAWHMAFFDLDAKAYVELPWDGHEMAIFENFYLGYNGYQTHTLYNLQNTSLRSKFRSLNLLSSEDAIAFVGPCEDGPWDFSEPICFRYFETDGQEVTREAKLNLSSYASESCQWATVNEEEKTVVVDYACTSLDRTPSMYLVAACDKVFFIPLDDLEIAEVVDFSSDEYGSVVYRYENLVVTQRVSGGRWPDYSYRTTMFDLDQCEGVLDETCISKTWAGSVVHSEAVKGWGERFYRSPPSSPALLFISGGGSLTIYDLDTQREAVLDGRLVGVSEDGTTVLFSKDEVYRLFALEDWRIIDVEAVPGQGLILARDWI
jgi:hypothetical protein